MGTVYPFERGSWSFQFSSPSQFVRVLGLIVLSGFRNSGWMGMFGELDLPSTILPLSKPQTDEKSMITSFALVLYVHPGRPASTIDPLLQMQTILTVHWQARKRKESQLQLYFLSPIVLHICDKSYASGKGKSSNLNLSSKLAVAANSSIWGIPTTRCLTTLYRPYSICLNFPTPRAIPMTNSDNEDIL
jgi:hypothetical protein